MLTRKLDLRGNFVVTGSLPSLTRNSAVESFLAASDEQLSDAYRLSERDYVNRALAFASTEDLGVLHTLELELTAGVEMAEAMHLHSLLEPAATLLQQLRDGFNKRLEAIRRKDKRARMNLANDIRCASERIVIRPTYVLSTTGVEVYFRYIPADLEAALAYVLMLLLDSTRPYGRDLCRCKLPDCRRFFLAIKPVIGRPRRDYCCEGHLQKSRALTGVERVQRYRERKRIAKEKATRRRSR